MALASLGEERLNEMSFNMVTRENVCPGLYFTQCLFKKKVKNCILQSLLLPVTVDVESVVDIS